MSIKFNCYLYLGIAHNSCSNYVQTLYFKFPGSEESVYIFLMLNMEPWRRIGIGIKAAYCIHSNTLSANNRDWC